jgi:uncharacterized protein YuzE
MTVCLGDWRFDSVEYDRESDVLYLSIGEPRAGVGEETPEGHVWRFDEEGQFCGLTLIGAQAILNSTDGEEVDITLPRWMTQRESLQARDLRRVLAC